MVAFLSEHGADEIRACGPDRLRPSEYTALLIQAIHLHADKVRGASVLEIGIGSGVVLRALATLGAARVSGVDIEQEAVHRARAMLIDFPDAVQGPVCVGDLWEPVAAQQFDVIVANLPHFPANHLELPERLESWSAGGPNGRSLLDRFLDGLSTHLAPNGLAMLTHNGFVDVEQTRRRLADARLVIRPVLTTLVTIEGEKRACLSPATRARFNGRSLHEYGEYLFGEVHVLMVTRLQLEAGNERPAVAIARR